jgi:hypothetical protein
MAVIDEPEDRELFPDAFPRYRQSRRSLQRDEQQSPDLFWNVLTVLVWLGIATMVMAFISIYKNPASSLNLLRPFQPTLVSVIVVPTELPIPSLDVTATFEPTFTEIPPTFTVTPTPEPAATETPTPGPSATPTIHTIFPFIVRNDPVAIAGDAMPDHDTCKLWVAGQTYDMQGAPMVGITVMLGGNIKGKTLYQLSLTGTSLQFGQAGYEFLVAEMPANSKGSVWVQLFDQALYPLSGRVPIDTFEDCKQNLILINFKQVR